LTNLIDAGTISESNLDQLLPGLEADKTKKLLRDLSLEGGNGSQKLVYEEEKQGELTFASLRASAQGRLRDYVIHQGQPLSEYLDEIGLPESCASYFYQSLGHAPWKQKRVVDREREAGRTRGFNRIFMDHFRQLKVKDIERGNDYQSFFQRLAQQLNALDGRGRKDHLFDYAKVLPEDALRWSSERSDVLDDRLTILEERASSEYQSLLEALEKNKDKNGQLARELGVKEELVDNLLAPLRE